jgi:hypothetical protein
MMMGFGFFVCSIRVRLVRVRFGGEFFFWLWGLVSRVDQEYSSLGIQVGGIGSSYGVLGSWTTVFHADDDPVGAFSLNSFE